MDMLSFLLLRQLWRVALGPLDGFVALALDLKRHNDDLGEKEYVKIVSIDLYTESATTGQRRVLI